MADIPVYLVAGFLDGGKTNFINGILEDGFAAKERTLLICCEEGEEEYDPRFLKNVTVVHVDEEEDLKCSWLKELEKKHRPKQIIIEYNGMWQMERLYREVLPAKIYMEENFSKSITISLLANLCCMSETDFRRKFNSVFNVSPMNYLNSLRISHAKAYISGGIYTIKEVAEKSGFGDANYFSRFFKKHTGLTPMEYKNIS